MVCARTLEISGLGAWTVGWWVRLVLWMLLATVWVLWGSCWLDDVMHEGRRRAVWPGEVMYGSGELERASGSPRRSGERVGRGRTSRSWSGLGWVR